MRRSVLNKIEKIDSADYRVKLLQILTDSTHGVHDLHVHLLAAVPNKSYLEVHGFGLERYIATDNTEALRNDPERSQAILARIPAGRWGEPEDFAGPVVFLASVTSDYLHGAVVLVDGGWMGR